MSEGTPAAAPRKGNGCSTLVVVFIVLAVLGSCLGGISDAGDDDGSLGGPPSNPSSGVLTPAEQPDNEVLQWCIDLVGVGVAYDPAATEDEILQAMADCIARGGPDE